MIKTSRLPEATSDAINIAKTNNLPKVIINAHLNCYIFDHVSSQQDA